MSLAFRGAGTQLLKGDGGSPENFSLVPELKTIEISGAKADLDDVTNLDSAGAFREYITTLLDGGEVSCTGNYLGNGSGAQTALLTDFNNQTSRNWKIVFPNSKGTATFTGWITEPPYPKVQHDKAVQFTFKVKVTGPVSFS